MAQRSEKAVLFLCTGNYYRSRFAEVLFNSVAGKLGLPWRASSRGLALERGVPVTFLVKDALTLKDWSERFDNVIDSGLFHVLSDEDRERYVDGLGTVLKPGGRLFLLCFSDEEPGTQGPRRVSRKELHDAFGEGWAIESVEPVRVEVRPDLKDMTFSEGGPRAWFVVVRREQ